MTFSRLEFISFQKYLFNMLFLLRILGTMWPFQSQFVFSINFQKYYIYSLTLANTLKKICSTTILFSLNAVLIKSSIFWLIIKCSVPRKYARSIFPRVWFNHDITFIVGLLSCLLQSFFLGLEQDEFSSLQWMNMILMEQTFFCVKTTSNPRERKCPKDLGSWAVQAVLLHAPVLTGQVSDWFVFFIGYIKHSFKLGRQLLIGNPNVSIMYYQVGFH